LLRRRRWPDVNRRPGCQVCDPRWPPAPARQRFSLLCSGLPLGAARPQRVAVGVGNHHTTQSPGPDVGQPRRPTSRVHRNRLGPIRAFDSDGPHAAGVQPECPGPRSARIVCFPVTARPLCALACSRGSSRARWPDVSASQSRLPGHLSSPPPGVGTRGAPRPRRVRRSPDLILGLQRERRSCIRVCGDIAEVCTVTPVRPGRTTARGGPRPRAGLTPRACLIDNFTRKADD